MLPEQWTGNNLQWEQWTENKKEAITLHGNTPYPPPFKTNLVMEELKEPYRLMLLKFRTSNHLLPIEKGLDIWILTEMRGSVNYVIWMIIGDEYHYFCCCTKFRNLRTKFIPRKFHIKPSVHKFCDLMWCKSKKQRLKTAKFINCIFWKNLEN